MGMISKVLGLKLAQTVVTRLQQRSARKDAQLRREYGPAVQAQRSAPQGWSANAVLNRAGSLYQQNPKLVASIATALLAGVAAAVAKKRGKY